MHTHIANFDPYCFHHSFSLLTGEDGDLDVGEDLVGVLKIKVELLMGSNLALRHDSEPFVVDRNLLIRVGSLEKDRGRVVTLEVRGIDFGLQQVALVTKTNDDEVVVVRSTRSLGFPSVTHVVTTTGQKKVTAGTIMLIANDNGVTTISKEGKIDNFTMEELKVS
jgi:hypothetical protein